MLIWIGPIIRLHDVAIPHNWLPPLFASDILSLYSFSSPCLAFGVLAVIALTALARPAGNAQAAAGASLPMLACSVAYLIPPLVIAVLSQGESSFFLDRYFLPSLIGAATLVTSLFDARLRTVTAGPALRVAWVLLFVIFLAWPIAGAEKIDDQRFRTIDQQLPPDVPVVVTDAQAFLPLSYLSQKPSRPYYYPLDWDAAVRAANRGITVDYKLMRNAKESGYSGTASWRENS